MGAMRRRRRVPINSNSDFDGAKRSEKPLSQMRIMLPPSLMAWSRTAFSLGCMYGDIMAPPFSTQLR